LALTLGDIAQSQNQLSQAQAWFEKSLELREAMLREANTPLNRRGLSVSYNRLGYIAQSQNQLSQAQVWFEKSLELREAMLREANTPLNDGI
jgi:tetratricopeptide (TPR) repeat protein